MYNSVLAACARSKDAEKAEVWLKFMLKDTSAVNASSFSIAIDTCVQAGDMDRAEKLIQETNSRRHEAWHLFRSPDHHASASHARGVATKTKNVVGTCWVCCACKTWHCRVREICVCAL